jgi:hypothetical protein
MFPYRERQLLVTEKNRRTARGLNAQFALIARSGPTTINETAGTERLE